MKQIENKEIKTEADMKEIEIFKKIENNSKVNNCSLKIARKCHPLIPLLGIS